MKNKSISKEKRFELQQSIIDEIKKTIEDDVLAETMILTLKKIDGMLLEEIRYGSTTLLDNSCELVEVFNLLQIWFSENSYIEIRTATGEVSVNYLNDEDEVSIQENPLGFDFIEKYDIEIQDYKLKFNEKPAYAHRKTLAQLLTKSLWSKIRKEILQKNKYTCDVCGFSVENPEDGDQTKRLHAHEVWEYDKEDLILCLKDINIKCVDCHACEHIKRTMSFASKESKDKLFSHISRVNNTSLETVKYYWNRYFKFDSINIFRQNYSEGDAAETLRLGRADWKIEVYDELPYRDKVIEQLKKKDMYMDIK